MKQHRIHALRENCPNTELFLVRILLCSDWLSLRIQPQYRKIRTRNNSEFGHFTQWCATDKPSVALELQASATKLFRWFKNNHLKANPGKSHILLSSKKPEIVSVDGISIAASSHEKLLGVIIDSELKFENHITEICLKVSKKNNALWRISSFRSLEKRRTLMKAFI